MLYFFQLSEENRVLNRKKRALKASASKENGFNLNSLAALSADKQGLFINTIVNAAYFPLTIHWSLEKSSLPDVGVGVFGTIAAIAQLHSAWKAS